MPSLKPSQTHEQPQLHRLFSEPTASKDKYRSTVIVIPDFDVPSVLSWQDGWNNCWLETRLPAIVSAPCVLSFEPGLRSGDGFSWRDVVEWGDLLLRQMLLHEESDPSFQERPVFFIAHGLGGLVVKRAISVLYERFYDPVYRGLIAAISGIVFLGCPSPAVNRARDLARVSTLLKAVSKQSSKSVNRASEHLVVTANISQKFSDAGFEAPVLSIYETKLSKLGKNIFSPRQLLVDRSFCETMTRRERLLGIESSHEDLCNLNSATSLEQDLTQFVSLALDLREANDQPPISIGQKSVTAWTISEVGDIRARMEDSSLNGSALSPGMATFGSSVEDFVHIPHLPSSTSLATDRQTAKLPCYLFGPHERNPDFLGRKDILKTLDKALLPNMKDPTNRNRLKTFALCGVGGLGKTQIAIEYVHSRKDQFDAIFWVHAADTARLANDYTQIAVGLGLEEADKAGDQVVVRSLVLQWLSASVEERRKDANTQDLSLTNAKWLLVFDNAESLADLRDYWPVSGVGSILITSRDPLAKTQTYFHSPDGMDLEPFTTEESAAWLRKLTRYDKTPEDEELSETIVEKLSNLPLAISQVAGAILRQDLSFAEFLEYYSQESFRSELYQSQCNGMQKPIWTVFAFKELSEEATALLDIICFLDPDSIPETTFTSVIGSPKAENISIKGFPKNKMSYVNARTILTRSSLLRRNIGLKELTIHRIVQDSAMGNIDGERLVSAFQTSLRLLTLAWPFTTADWDVGRWKQCEPLFPHILHLSRCYHMSQTLQENDEYNNEFGTLLAYAGWYQLERGGHIESLATQQLAEKLLETAPTVNNLALSYTHLAQSEVGCCTDQDSMALSEARKCVECIKLVDFTKLPPHKYPELPRAYLQLGEALIANREYDEALVHYNHAIKLLNNDPGHYIHLFSHVGKAFCLWRQGGKDRCEEASNVMEEALAIKERSISDSDPSPFATGLLTIELGNVRAAQGHYDEALDIHMRGYKQYLTCLSRNHFRIAGLLAKIAVHYHHNGDLERAKDKLQESLAVYGNRSIYAAEITWTSFLLVKVLEDLQDPIAAEARRGAQYELLEFSLKIGRRVEEGDLESHLATWAL